MILKTKYCIGDQLTFIEDGKEVPFIVNHIDIAIVPSMEFDYWSIVDGKWCTKKEIDLRSKNQSNGYTVNTKYDIGDIVWVPDGDVEKRIIRFIDVIIELDEDNTVTLGNIIYVAELLEKNEYDSLDAWEYSECYCFATEQEALEH